MIFYQQSPKESSYKLLDPKVKLSKAGVYKQY